MSQSSTSTDQNTANTLAPSQRNSNHALLKPVTHLDSTPVLVHPNFDPTRTPIDPDRPLTDIPDPAPNLQEQLQHLYLPNNPSQATPDDRYLSKWALIASDALRAHLELLTVAGLIRLPNSFYHGRSQQPLIAPLAQMRLIDMADIHHALLQYPNLTRYGLTAPKTAKNNTSKTAKKTAKPHNIDNFDPDQLLNSQYAPDWEVILYPERFDNFSNGNFNDNRQNNRQAAADITTDILACSVAVHALKTCDTRSTINRALSADDICHYLRSYLLSQVANNAPNSSLRQKQAYRHIRLFSGHVIVAAVFLNWQIYVDDTNQCYFNVSSRSALFSRYPNLNDYYINGWH